MSEVKVNKISPRTNCGTVQLGDSGDTITIPAGATITNNGTQTGFGRTGTVNWDTTAKTASFTAVSGNGYFVNTTSGAITVTTPASPSAGDIFSLADYAATWDTNNVTLTPNGTDKIGGENEDAILSTAGQSVTLVYVDGTQGWINTMDSTSNVRGIGTYDVQYLVVAGGGGGGESYGGGGGAGGYRTVSSKTFTINSGQSYPITVGAGGNHANVSSPGGGLGCNGSNSVFSTITSAGGGGGGYGAACSPGKDGGSGGGGGAPPAGYSGAGAGNTPPVTPPQGNPGSPTAPSPGAGGGGGASAAGSGLNGGNGSPFVDLGPLAPSYGTTGPQPGRYFGGGGGGYNTGTGGAGGGGGAGVAGVANTGGGSGGRTSTSGNGGSGIVIIRYVTADASPTVSGGNATATCGSDTIRVFTGPGTFTS